MLALGRLLELALIDREPMEKIQLTADGTRLHWRSHGALEVTPLPQRDNGVDLILSAGIHGNESAPIELLDRLLHQVANGELKPASRILFLFGNPGAIRRGERYLEQDMNRLFNGRHEEFTGDESMRAAELERLAAAFWCHPGRVRRHYDLHTSLRASKIERFAVHPWAPGRTLQRPEMVLLRQLGMEAVLLQNKSSWTFSAYCYEQLNAEAFTLELGKTLPLTSAVDLDLSWLETGLKNMINGELETSEDLEGLSVFSVSRELIKRSEQFRLNLPEETENFTELSPDFLVAEDAGGISWIVKERNARIVFPNPCVKMGDRAGLLVVPHKL